MHSVCVCMCVYACVCMCVHVCMYVCVCNLPIASACTQAHVYVCNSIPRARGGLCNAHTPVCVHACVRVCVCVCVCVCTIESHVLNDADNPDCTPPRHVCELHTRTWHTWQDLCLSLTCLLLLWMLGIQQSSNSLQMI